MKKAILILLLLFTTWCYGQTKVCIIGTFHEENNIVNPNVLLNILNKIKPDVILIELDSTFFTNDFLFDLKKHPDILSTNENIASHQYQKEHNIVLRPYDIAGRNEFYREASFHQNENEMFREIYNLYTRNGLSEQCKTDFEVLLTTLKLYSDTSYSSLEEVNSDVNQKFTEAKYKLTNELMISIAANTKELNKWKEFAWQRKEFWDKRNITMANNIAVFAKEYANKTIVVLSGFEHKYYIVKLLKEKGLQLKEFWDFSS